MSELNCMNCRIGDFKNSLCDCDSSFYAKYKGIGTGKDFIDALSSVQKNSDIDEAVKYIKSTQEYLTDIGETWYADYLSGAIDLLGKGEKK